MRFFHLSDLHIGLKLYQRDLKEDLMEAFGEIIQYARKYEPAAILVAGDIYDKSIPSAEAVEILDWFIDHLHDAMPQTALLFIAGNHDNAQRIDCFRNILKRQNVYMVGLPPADASEYIEKVTLMDDHGPVNFYLLPFVKPSMVRGIWEEKSDTSYSYDETIQHLLEREHINMEERNVLVSHQFYLPKGKQAEDIDRTDTENVTVGNIDAVSASHIASFDYAALGHIHKKMKAGADHLRYCGTPIAGSISEAGQKKSILMVDMEEKGSPVTVTELELHPTRSVRILEGAFEELILEPTEDYVSVILTDEKDLDTFDLKDKLRIAFPNLLEIRRKRKSGLDFSVEVKEEKISDPVELIREFFPDISEQEQKILDEVMREAQEALTQA